MELGEYLRSCRVKKNMTTVELAERSGVSRPYISQIEKGSKDPPSEKVLRKIAAALNINLHVLMSLKNKNTIPDEYLKDAMDFDAVYQKMQEIKEAQNIFLNQHRNLAKRYVHQKPLMDISKKMEDALETLKYLSEKNQASKYSLRMENIITELLEIGEPGQAFVQKQIKIYKEMVEGLLKK